MLVFTNGKVRAATVVLLVNALGLAGAASGAAAAATPAAALRSSCRQVAHLGDSTSESLISPAYLPDPAQRIQAQYARVGVPRQIMEIVGANSIVETLPGDENGYDIARGLVDAGYQGCWVLALGTNDAADVAIGSNVGMAARIQRMMALIGKRPVLWVNVKTLVTSGAYAEANMKQWDNALLAACARYPNMRVFNWAHLANPAWFTTDGIHYTSTGSAIRSAAIADALATAFPAQATAHKTFGPASTPPWHGSCVVNWSPTWHLPTTYMP